MSKVTDLLMSAVELNLRYTSTLLHLSTDYLKDAGDVLGRGEATTPAPAPAPAPPPAPDTTTRPPLLIAGRSGDVANGAFAINNPSGHELSAHLVVQGEPGDGRVRLEPAHFTLKPGDSIIVRVLVPMDETLEAERDHVGSVVAPGLSAQSVPFIVRRLRTDAPPPE